METIQKICLAIATIGAINWGLIGIVDFNLVAAIFGEASVISKVIYALVGVCGFINLGILFSDLKMHD